VQVQGAALITRIWARLGFVHYARDGVGLEDVGQCETRRAGACNDYR
jgi:hypothetical protein